MIQHLNLIHQHYEGVAGVRFARKHIKWYLKVNTNVFGASASLFEQFAALEDSVLQADFIANL
jgi:tRNA-dihydrouridine synthase